MHLAPKPGTNVVVLNGLLHLIIQNGWIGRAYIDAHTMGFEDLERQSRSGHPNWWSASPTCHNENFVPRPKSWVRRRRSCSAVLQGVYQSMQATAAACQVNNLHLIRGLIGRDGCGVYQMNGQPTAQNTREYGADGDLPGFRNWSNPSILRNWPTLECVIRTSFPIGRPRHMPCRSFVTANKVPSRCSGSRPRIRPSRCRIASHSPHSRSGKALPRRSRCLHDRNSRARRCRLAGGHLGRKDGMFHKRRSDGRIFRTKRSSRPAKPDRIRHFFWTTLAAWIFAIRMERL